MLPPYLKIGCGSNVLRCPVAEKLAEYVARVLIPWIKIMDATDTWDALGRSRTNYLELRSR
jgi:hypothetical protein